MLDGSRPLTEEELQQWVLNTDRRINDLELEVANLKDTVARLKEMVARQSGKLLQLEKQIQPF
jgi:uncharacterized coiled-coil protein SlyX